jgi:FMN phosphatase YigB (HAD superfamily)
MESSLVLFDLDDTLLITDAKIVLRDLASNEVVYRVSTDEFRDLKKQARLNNTPLIFQSSQTQKKLSNPFSKQNPVPLLIFCETL